MSDFICHGKANPNPKTSAAEPRATNAPLSLLKVFNEKDKESGSRMGRWGVGWIQKRGRGLVGFLLFSVKYSDIKEHVCVCGSPQTPLPMGGD